MIKLGSLGRDCTYIRVGPLSPATFLLIFNNVFYSKYEATVDRNARFKNKQPEMALETFFGELQRIVKINVPASPSLRLDVPQTLFYAIVRQCNARKSREGFWEYTLLGGLEAVDIGLIQCVVGRIFDRGKWTIIDRSGTRAHVDIEAGEIQ